MQESAVFLKGSLRVFEPEGCFCMLLSDKKKPKQRSWKEQNYISNAKMLLMERNHLSEEDAYRYIQKCSMDSGTNMVETAQMVLMLLYDEV